LVDYFLISIFFFQNSKFDMIIYDSNITIFFFVCLVY
jgi:hypothetical protein